MTGQSRYATNKGGTPTGRDTQRNGILAPEVLDRIREVGSAHIVVGIPSFDNASTIDGVVTAVEAGLRKQFPESRAVICVSDGGSSDGTPERALAAGVGDRAEELLVPPDPPGPEKIVFRYRGTPGKGSAFRSIFEVARRLEIDALAVVDADLRSITPYWLDRLLTPVVHLGYGFVAPLYSRHKFDGTITNSLAYPVTTALYGTRVRQPIGGEFALSGELAAHYASQDVWDTDVARFGIDIWMTTVAVVEGYRTCQAVLGAKLHDPKDPGKDLGPMFAQVVGSLFALAGRYRDRWAEPTEIRVPPTFGFRAAFTAEPVQVSVPRLHWKFVDGYVRHHRLWQRVLSEECFAALEEVVGDAAEDQHGLRLDARLWTMIVYDYLVAYNARREDPTELLGSLVPLYFARTATFVEEARGDTDQEAEARVNACVDVAVELKAYLRERWASLRVPARGLADQPVPEEGEPTGEPEEALATGGP